MNLKSLQIKIIVIFSIPAVALIYFSYSLVHTNYIKYKESVSYASSAQYTLALSKLIHNIQLERGLSAGYLVSEDTNIKKNLLQQFNNTNNAYKNLLNFSNEHQQLRKKFDTISILREKVLHLKISFTDEIKYYTALNKELLIGITALMHNLTTKKYNGRALIELQKLKESVGLERAYIYNQILAPKQDEKYIRYIRLLQKEEKQLKMIFEICASKETQQLFQTLIQEKTVKKIQNLRKMFFLGQLNSQEDAQVWFSTSSEYIIQIYTVSNKILNAILADALQTQKEIKKVFIFTAVLWVLSIISFLFLVYILNALINKENKLLKKIRIASYTFDSHEAIVITDRNGTVLEVNYAFTKITGYEPNEIIGQKARLLKSDKHSRKFYVDMWHQLLESGKWNGDIYNKRKNGEVYPERLSITAIKNKNGEISNFIAQFYDISDLRNAQQEAVYQANHDFLTALLNRKALLQRLHEENAKARRHNFIHAFLFIDLDNFKNVNDTYGHHIGDKLLIQVSQRMKALLREEDILARMSGDEFAVILVNIANEKETAKKYAEQKCHSIIAALSEAFIIEGNEIYIGASIGIKIFPDEKNNIESIIHDADEAMYLAKKDGKNNCSIYDDTDPNTHIHNSQEE